MKLTRYLGDKPFWQTTLRIAVPIVIQNLLTSSFALVDTLMVSSLGDLTLSATGMAGQWNFVYNMLIFGITAALLGYDYLFSYMVNESLGKLLRIVFVVAAAVWLMLACYTFPLQAQFQNRVKRTLQNALFLALAHLGQTVTVMLIHLVPVAVCLALPELFARLLPLWIFAAPGLIAFLCTLRLRKLWASLRQQAEAVSEEAQ